MTSSSIGPGELARLTGVSADTLRHYERLGLLPGTVRTPAGYRQFRPEMADRVRIIQRALAVGFSLKDLAQTLDECQRGGVPCRRVRNLVGDRLESFERRLEELMALREDMRTLLAEWDERLSSTPAGQRARLLDMLAGHVAIDRARRLGRRSLRTGLPTSR